MLDLGIDRGPVEGAEAEVILRVFRRLPLNAAIQLRDRSSLPAR